MDGKRKIRIKVSPNGEYTLEAMEGFSGTSCVEQTKSIEVILGGTEVSRGKKDEYYNPDSPNFAFTLN